MKKFLLIIVIITIPYLLNAQFDNHSVGIKGGVNWTSLRSSPAISQPTWPLQYHFGIQYRLISGKYCGFIVESNYEKLFRFFFELGPFIAFMVKDNIEEGAMGLEQTMAISNIFDYGIAAGLGFEFNTKYGIYIIDGRFNFGLGNIFPSTGGSDFSISSNLGASVSVGYLFPITHDKRDNKLHY